MMGDQKLTETKVGCGRNEGGGKERYNRDTESVVRDRKRNGGTNGDGEMKCKREPGNGLISFSLISGKGSFRQRQRPRCSQSPSSAFLPAPSERCSSLFYAFPSSAFSALLKAQA